MNYNLQGKTWEGASDLPGRERTCSGRRRELWGTTEREPCGCSRLGVKEIPTILEKAKLLGATHAFHFVQLLLDRMQPRLNLSLVHLASGEPIKASIKCVVNVLIGFLLVTHSFSLGNQRLCAQAEAC